MAASSSKNTLSLGRGVIDNNVNGLGMNWTFNGFTYSVITSTDLVSSWFGSPIKTGFRL